MELKNPDGVIPLLKRFPFSVRDVGIARVGIADGMMRMRLTLDIFISEKDTVKEKKTEPAPKPKKRRKPKRRFTIEGDS